MIKLLSILLLLPSILYAGEREDNWGRFRAGVRDQVMEEHKVTFITCYFTGVAVPKEAIQIDHVVPVNVAEKLGALEWSMDKRRDFFNNPVNLVPVIGGLNSSKGDRNPKSFLPKINKKDYLNRWETICALYQMDCSQEF